MTVYVVDCETTGISKTDQVIELAYFNMKHLGQDVHHDTLVSTYYKPSVNINPRAYEVHGIAAHSIANCPPSRTVTIPKDITYIIGHNISFDKRMLTQSNGGLTGQLNSVRYICTLELARTISKFCKLSYENHKLDTLVRYYYPDTSFLYIHDKHSAKEDVIKTVLVLNKLVEHVPKLTTFDDLYDFLTTMKKVK